MTPLLCAALLALPLCGQAPAAFWRTQLDVALRDARQDGRPVVIYFTTADCFWCRKLEAGPLADPAVRQELGRFVRVKIDGAGGPARDYGVRAYPTLVRLDADGGITRRQTGYLDAAALARWLRAD